MDIEEKPQCHDVYDRFVVQSVEDPIGGEYDLVMSITLLEHVRDNASSIANIFDALRPTRETHHYIPGKGHPYALALRAVGPKWQKRLIQALRPDSVEETGYPAFFHHCTARDMVRIFEDVGFEDVRAKNFYRANHYFSFFSPRSSRSPPLRTSAKPSAGTTLPRVSSSQGVSRQATSGVRHLAGESFGFAFVVE
jgi:hypothetical protein